MSHNTALEDKGGIVLREKIARGRITARLANVPRCLIGIEAGMATHYVARELTALGYDVKQVPPAYAKPFRQGHNNDLARCLFCPCSRTHNWHREVPRSIFARFLGLSDFRLLQQYRHFSDMPRQPDDVR
jgi:transposase